MAGKLCMAVNNFWELLCYVKNVKIMGSDQLHFIAYKAIVTARKFGTFLLFPVKEFSLCAFY